MPEPISNYNCGAGIMCLSGPTIIFGAVVVVPLCAVAAGVVDVVSDEVVGVVLVPLCVWLELFVVAAGAGLVAELPLFFFVFAVGALCAMAIDPAIRNALIQKLAANFKYLFIDALSHTGFRLRLPIQYTRRRPTPSIQLPRQRTPRVAALRML